MLLDRLGVRFPHQPSKYAHRFSDDFRTEFLRRMLERNCQNGSYNPADVTKFAALFIAATEIMEDMKKGQ